jgi:putative tricarboxylic transport membrane protein
MKLQGWVSHPCGFKLKIRRGAFALKKLGVYVALFFLVFSGVVFWLSLQLRYSSQFGPGPGFLPLWTSGLLFLFSVFYLVMAFKKDIILIKDVFPKGEGFVNVLVTFLSLILFMALVKFAGFVITGIITLFLLFSRGYKWYWSLGLATTVTLVVFGLFGQLLGIPLPVNDYGW